MSPWLIYQALRYRKYVASLPQRLGYLPVAFNIDAEPSIWIHAVSVGELLTARPLIAALRERHPGLRLFVSTTTMSAQQLARRSVPDADAVFYFPFDLAMVVRRTLDLVRPRLFLMMETEIWPTLLRECRARGIRTAVVNGRLSARSFPRYRLARGFFRRVLDDIDVFCVQSEESARRFVEIGAARRARHRDRQPQVRFAGADRRQRPAAARPRAPLLPLRAGAPGAGGRQHHEGRRSRWCCASSGGSRPSSRLAVLIMAPRHPERFAEVVQLSQQEGFRTVRRSDLPIDAEPRGDVVVLDTIGELATVYQLGTVVFVGGSLVATGGHNILEPAVYGRPVVFGPHMQNFAEIATAFVANGAGVQVDGEGAFEEQVLSLMSDPVRRARLGAAARALVEANRGAKEKTLAVLDALLPPPRRAYRANVRPFRAP